GRGSIRTSYHWSPSQAPAPATTIGKAVIVAAIRRSRLSAGDRGEDGDDVAVGHLGVELVEVPDIVVVAVHVAELVDAARLVDQLVCQTRVAGGEIGEHIAHGGAGGGHRRRPAGVRPQKRGQANLDGHAPSLQVRPDGSGLSLSGRGPPGTRRSCRRGPDRRAAPAHRPAGSRARRSTPGSTWPSRLWPATGSR